MSLYSQLDACLVPCPLEDSAQTTGFLPLSDLNEKITHASIQAQLSYFCWIRSPGLPGKVLEQAKKVFAILVFLEEARAIEDLIYNDDIRDEDLPLVRKGGRMDPDYNVLKSPGTGKIFTSFKSWPKECTVRDFLENQWVVQAPVLDVVGKHIVLDKRCPLPLTKSVLKAKGGMGVVYKSQLHPSHQRIFPVGLFSPAPHQTTHTYMSKKGAEPYIAIKEARDIDGFLKEKKNLEIVQRLRHDHLIKLIATCEKGSLYYSMFPWADGGNLRDFWWRNDSAARTPDLLLWSLRQMLGIVDAVKALHRKNIRHGDIKPLNILHFSEGHNTSDSRGTLVIADVGVSSRHKEATNLRNVGTSTKEATASYEAPEAEYDRLADRPRTRRYDMWSMGCMFLEFTVWLIYNFSAVKAFRDLRRSPNDPNTSEGIFFTRRSDSLVEIHSAVSGAIRHLRDNPLCRGGTALGDLINVIEERLLQIDLERRANADELHTSFERIVRAAEEVPGYMGQRANSSTIPDFFTRRKNSDSSSRSAPLATETN
ncbi:hypothetical protein ACJZ2D_006508 [Fusarium nematophilum]